MLAVTDAPPIFPTKGPQVMCWPQHFQLVTDSAVEAARVSDMDAAEEVEEVAENGKALFSRARHEDRDAAVEIWPERSPVKPRRAKRFLAPLLRELFGGRTRRDGDVGLDA